MSKTFRQRMLTNDLEKAKDYKKTRAYKDLSRQQKKNFRYNVRVLKLNKFETSRRFARQRRFHLESIGGVLKIIFLLFLATIIVSFMTNPQSIRMPSFSTFLYKLQTFEVIKMIDMTNITVGSDFWSALASVGIFLINGITQTINLLLFFVRWLFA